ncbi:MAG: glycosyltransferase family 39 protein [Sedimentisphaerales bacterium]
MSNRKITQIVFLVVVAVSVLTAFWGISIRPLGNHEAYVAVSAREMIKTGNWLVPYFNGEPRLQKTPLNYWIVAAAAKAAGQMNEFAVRLPSAALAVLSVIAIFYFVSERLNARIAALSSLIWATSLCYIAFTHTGRPEMSLAVFVTISMLSFYSAVKTYSRKKQILYMLIFWLSFSLAMIAKGPAPLPLIFPALIFYFAIFRRWKVIPRLLPIIGIVIFLLIMLPWPAIVLMKVPGAVEIWKNEFFGRAIGEYASGEKEPYYYLGVMFVYLLPFSAFIPLALASPFYRIWEERRETITYMWLWFVVGIVMMSLMGGKRQHYILPLMPAVAILAGIIFDDMVFVNKAYSRRFAAVFWLGHLIAVFYAAAGAIVWMRTNKLYPEQLLIWVTAAVMVVISFNISVLFWLNKKAVAVLCLFIVLCAFIIMWPYLAYGPEDENYVIYDFGQRVSIISAGKEITAFGKADAAFIYYFGKDVPGVSDINEVYTRYSSGGGIIANGDNFRQLRRDWRFKTCIFGLDWDRGLFMKDRKNGR